MIDHDQYRDSIAAYALGALPDDERSQLERHMATCHDCRLEADELALAVAELPDAADPVAPPPELRSRIMAVVEADAAERTATSTAPAQRAGWGALLRPRAALVAACVLLLAGLGAGVALTGDDGGSWQAEVVMADASAEVDMASDHATLAVRGMPAPPTGRVYQVWVQRGAGAPRPTQALFTTDPSGAATVRVEGRMKGVDAVLVTDEPKGGSRAPTRSPVIVARPA
jgi:anti-sigma-K factor RskA